MRRDGRNRPGFNGGIVMAAMAGGTGIQFEKPGVYTIGDGERTLEEAGTGDHPCSAGGHPDGGNSCRLCTVFIGCADQ